MRPFGLETRVTCLAASTHSWKHEFLPSPSQDTHIRMATRSFFVCVCLGAVCGTFALGTASTDDSEFAAPSHNFCTRSTKTCIADFAPESAGPGPPPFGFSGAFQSTCSFIPAYVACIHCRNLSMTGNIAATSSHASLRPSVTR